MKTSAILTFAVAAVLAPAGAWADCHFMRCRALAEAFADSWNAASRSADSSASVFPGASAATGDGERGGPRAQATQEPRPTEGKDAIRAAAGRRPLWELFHATGKLMEPSVAAHTAVTREQITELFKTGPLRESVYQMNPKKIKFRTVPGQKLELAEWKGVLVFADRKIKHRVFALFVKVGAADEDWLFDTIAMVPQ